MIKDFIALVTSLTINQQHLSSIYVTEHNDGDLDGNLDNIVKDLLSQQQVQLDWSRLGQAERSPSP